MGGRSGGVNLFQCSAQVSIEKINLPEEILDNDDNVLDQVLEQPVRQA